MTSASSFAQDLSVDLKPSSWPKGEPGHNTTEAAPSGTWQLALHQAQGAGDLLGQTMSRTGLRPLAQPFVMSGAPRVDPDSAIQDPATFSKENGGRLSVGLASDNDPQSVKAQDLPAEPAAPTSDDGSREEIFSQKPGMREADGLPTAEHPATAASNPLLTDETKSSGQFVTNANNRIRLSLSIKAEDAPESSESDHEIEISPDPSERDPLRVHTQWSAEGVRIWLGIDAAQALPLASVTEQLRRSVAVRGERLVSIVCNGQVVYEDPAISHLLDQTKEHS
jgi:hypothetical protein